MSIPHIEIFQLPYAQGIPLPAYETDGAAGMDLRAAVGEGETLTLAPGSRDLIPTGLIMAIPDGFEGQVRPRSGLALKHGITCLNTPGTIDADYRGEIKVLLVNLGHEPFIITRAMRIAQMVIAPAIQAQLRPVNSPPNGTERGAGGFGSTGSG
ncbi:MAG: dUTP diphosphatase [Pseudomonadota bacterium]